MRTKCFLTFLLLLTFSILFGRDCKANFPDSIYKKPRTSYGVGFVPSNTQKIHGWAIGWIILGVHEDRIDSVRINGIYTNFSPLALITALIGLPYIVTMPFNVFKNSSDTSYLVKQVIENKINGIALSIMEDSKRYGVNGIQISAFIISMNKLKGISLSAGCSQYYSFDGLMLSGLYNNAENGRGVQIGLVNNAYKMKGIQIGLWNKIGRRAFPFLNFNFKSK